MCGNASAQNKVLGLRANGSLKEKKRDFISVTVLKCNKCGYVYANPQPIDANAKQKYTTTNTQNYWNIESAEPSQNHYEVELKTLQKLKGNDLKNVNVLDIGFGLGRTLHTLHKQRMEVWGIEPFESFYESAKNNTKLNLGIITNIKVSNNSLCAASSLLYYTAPLTFITGMVKFLRNYKLVKVYNNLSSLIFLKPFFS